MVATTCVVLLFHAIAACRGEEMFLSNPHRGERYTKGTFAKIEDMSAKNILKTTQVSDAFQCLSDCLSHPTCQSVNFQSKGSPKHLCELCENILPGRPCVGQRSGYYYLYPLQNLPLPNCTGKCKNGGICKQRDCGPGSACQCGKFNTKEYCDQWTTDISSCKDIYSKTSYRTNMAYTFSIDNKPTDIYCHLTDDICGGGGWTLAMKIDCTKAAQFKYSAALWSNKQSYNLTAGQTGFDNYQTKMPSYWAMPFDKLCVGFKDNNVLKWAVIPYRASSLYDVIADGAYRPTSIGRAKWMSLIGGAWLQPNCNKEGFNDNNSYRVYSRIGIMGNNENDCKTPDTHIGFGLNRNDFSCGNPGNKIPQFGYIMIQ